MLGIVSLPAVAYLLDGQRSENWIIPVQIAAMAVVGAVVSVLLPLAPPGSSTIHRLAVGAATGAGMAVIGLGVFWLLLGGFSGA